MPLKNDTGQTEPSPEVVPVKVISKPWGQEEVLELNSAYLVKRLTMNKGHRCSLQYHQRKRETIYVLSGRLKIYLGHQVDQLSETIYLPHQSVTIESGQIHRMEGVETSVYLEASTPDMEDVVRLQDDYRR
jgi:mannose-6-phosphate isomerase-like protein (cupin superfamily)